MKELMGVLEPVAQSGRSLLIIAEDVDGEALSALGGQQAARYAEDRSLQGSGLRRPPQGDARGYRYPDGCYGDLRPTRV